MTKAAAAVLLAACMALGQSRGYIAADPPANLTPAKNLSAADRTENFEYLWKAVDTSYACFKLKSIDWDEVARRYRKQLEAVANDDDFYLLLFQMVAELKDTHSWLQNYRPPVLRSAPPLGLDLFPGGVFVAAAGPMSEVRPGWELIEVDGLSIAEKMEALRPLLSGRSSDRAYRRDAARALLAGERGTTVTAKFRPPEGEVRTLSLPRNASPLRRPAPSPPCEITRQKFVHFGRHPSGLGYIWIASFGAHAEVADEFDIALQALRDTPALILDIRDNPGGFGQGRIVGRLLKKRSLVEISYIKNGPRHGDVARNEQYLGPGGPWQYTRPIALLINDGTGSASDLFACQLRSAGRVLAVGSTTHGNLSGVATYAVLPCGVVVRISNGFICDSKERPIEGRGTAPDIEVVPTIADFLSGRDTVMEKAVAALLRP